MWRRAQFRLESVQAVTQARDHRADGATTAPALLPSAKHSYLFNGWRVLGRKSSNPPALLPNPEPIGGSLLLLLKIKKNVKEPQPADIHVL